MRLTVGLSIGLLIMAGPIPWQHSLQGIAPLVPDKDHVDTGPIEHSRQLGCGTSCYGSLAQTSLNRSY
jgi:hypothetical protein